MAHPRRSAERRAFTRGEGACNVEFQAVVRQHKEARAEPSGPFAGIDEREFFALLLSQKNLGDRSHFSSSSGRRSRVDCERLTSSAGIWMRLDRWGRSSLSAC